MKSNLILLCMSLLLLFSPVSIADDVSYGNYVSINLDSMPGGIQYVVKQSLQWQMKFNLYNDTNFSNLVPKNTYFASAYLIDMTTQGGIPYAGVMAV